MFDLKRFRNDFGLTQKMTADILHCGQPNISSIEKGRRDLEYEQRKSLVELYGEETVSKYEIKEDSPYSTSVLEELIQQVPKNYTTYLLPLGAAGGTLTGFSEDGASLANCEQIVSPIKDVDFAITVYGDSMSPEYPSGSRILIKRINPNIFIDWGKTYVLDTTNGVVVKEVHASGKEGYVRCHSVNPDPKFADFDVPLAEIRGMYRVLLCMSMK